MDATWRAEPPKIHIALLMDWQRTCASAVHGHESMVTVLEQVARTCGARLHKVSGAEIADGFLTQWRPALLVLGVLLAARRKSRGACNGEAVKVLDDAP